MQLRQHVLDQIHHRPTRPVPYTLPIEKPMAARLDTHYGGQQWRNKIKPYMVTVTPINTIARTAISETHGRDIYGTLWRTDRRPIHLETPALEKPSFQGYEFPRFEDFLDPECEEICREICRNNPDKFLVGSIPWGLFERSWTIRGYENALTDVAAEPAFYEELLDRLTELYLSFVERVVAYPVDGIFFGDDWGDQRGVILGPERWRKLIKPRWARIYEAVHAAGKITMSHCCGSVAEIMGDIVEMGLDVLESVQPEAEGMIPYQLKEQWGDKITFWGGLGSQSILPFGSPQQIKQEVTKLCREMAKGGGYILAPAKPLQLETPIQNAVAAIEAFNNQDG